MSRTTIKKVQDVLGNNYDSSVSLSPYIDAANSVVSDVSSCASDRSVTLTSAKLELVERYLAAHYYTQADPLYRERQTADGKGVFVEHSFLHVAYDLDKSGCLRAIVEGNQHQIQVDWLGLPPSEQTDYEDRD